MAALICEVVYRGIFQKNLAARITRGIVLSARKSGRWGIAFGRYGDSPQRNGIPAKDFAIVADTQSRARAEHGALRAQARRRHDRRGRHPVEGRRVVGLVRAAADQPAHRTRTAPC